MTKYKRALLFGTFNPLHCGHLRLFRKALELADEVYVCIDSDSYVRSWKKREPFGSEEERIADIEMINGIHFAGIEDQFIGRTKEYWIDQIKPDVLIKGDDTNKATWNGKNLGVKVEYVEHTPCIHSTNIWNGNG